MLDTKVNGNHSLISPSGAARWTACPASVRFGMQYEDTTNAMAQRGTDIHQLGEMMLNGEKINVGTSIPRECGNGMFWANADMLAEAQAYHDYVHSLATEPDAEIMAEQKVDIIPEYDVSGHIDATVINGDTLHIVDLKTGRGPVSAEGNLQLQMYALGTLDSLFEDFEKVVLHIVQDNNMIHNTNSWETTPEDLEDFREWVTEKARLALQEDSECVPSEAACQWCPHAGNCEALTKEVTDAFDDLDATTEDEVVGKSVSSDMDTIIEFMKKKPLLDIAFKAYESRIEDELRAGKEVKGFKLIRATTRKKWVNETEAYDKLKSWLPLDEVAPRKLATPTQVAKMLGKDISTRKKNVFEELWEQPEGELKCVPESARGKAVVVGDMFEEL